ncbi:MAG TPA: PQQ-dependent sugar dehydrogenase, partial [Anaerolineales bacterium]
MPRFTIRTTMVVINAVALLSLTLLVVNRPAHQQASAKASEPVKTPPLIASTAAFTLSIELVSSGFNYPTYVTGPADGSGRLFVLEQAGRIRVISNSLLLNLPYLDISNTVTFNTADSELGLLGMAFDPAFASNGTFYLDYTNLESNTIIERFVVADPAADVATLLTATKIMTIVQPYAQHKGGVLQFGPNDGYLYIGMGDGGGGGDPLGNGQNLDTLLGKILRIDVRHVPTYTIPPTNPFTQTADALPEIWAYGLRNPWRFSFDRANGDLYIGDVGQHCYEEIDYQASTSHGGDNYGWNIMEGFHGFDPQNYDACAQPVLTSPPPTLTLPVLEYPHSGLLAAVVGGYV